MPNVTVHLRIASTYAFWVTVFGAIFFPRCRQTTSSKTSRTSWSASSAPSTASTVCAPIWWPPSTSSTSSSMTSRAACTCASSPASVSWFPRSRTVHLRRSRRASRTPSSDPAIPASSAATSFETSRTSCIGASVGTLCGDAGRALIVPLMKRKWWTLVSVCVAIFMLLLDITVVNVALPSIQSSLDASFTELQWVIDAYALTLATCVLTAGSVSDIYGRRRIFAIGIVLFTIASALCGAAPDPLFLILARGLQGIGGAIMFATSLSLISQEFHGRERGTAFGIWGATTGAAVAIGPLIGGILTSGLSWRWIFFVNIPIGIAAVAITLMKLAESSDPEHGSIDPIGLVLLTGGLFSLVFALIEGNDRGGSSPLIVGLLVAAVALLVGFLVQQSRRARPMLDVRLFRVPAFTGAQIAAFTLSASLFAMFLYLTLYIQQVLGYSPLQAGLRFLPITLLAFFV